MGFDTWSLRDKVIFIWSLAIASAAILFVAVSLGNLISDNSSNIASWVQAIGSILAIVGVWWQTKTQLLASENRLRHEDAKKAAASLIRSSFLLRSAQAVCIEIKEFHCRFEEQRKVFLESHAQRQSFRTSILGSDSDFPSPNYEQYHSALSSVFIIFDGFPYWDISDTEVATKFLSVGQSARLCLLILKFDPNQFSVAINKLLAEIDGFVALLDNRSIDSSH